MNKPGTNSRTRTDVLLLVAFCGFLFFYGLGAFGLLGADEPRYAQVAREMLERSDWITPTLQGKPWLEKPVLYYWQAMLSFRVAGVTDQAARLPAAFDAALLIAVIYLFLRRFRPGSELDGALITASCAGVIGFARAAATDMPLAAAFSIALLAWYAWYESRRHICLAAFYIALALGTLAKGPVAPALSAVIIFLFVAVRRDWRAIPRTLWIPGIAVYLAVTLPWYIAVQLRNPEFFRFFILEHNLARFSHDVYHHREPFWFYLPVFLLAMMPWTLPLILAVAERVRWVRAEGKQAFSSPEASWPLFLLIWMLVPILFFSASQSKLPGYILPAVPAGALLIAEYLASRGRGQFFNAEGAEVSQRSRDDWKLSPLFAATHGILCGVLIFAALSAASIAMNHHLLWGSGTYVAAAIAAVFALGISVALLSRAGARLLRPVTMFAVVVSVWAVIRLAAPAIDVTQSARPIARSIQAFSHEPVPITLYHVNRVLGYGLEFYFNRPVQPYESGNIPAAAHVLVAAQGTQLQVAQLVPGRRVSYLTSIPEQKL
ncbi:MAG TPA: glycosyltransferase family 39 protein, partial [Terriglobales bacterium]|nr:glycosyltransferase family 39 protein [Terriglobales bacterium]